jgi:GLPGLI family protein
MNIMTKVVFRITFAALALFANATQAQQFYGRAIYESKMPLPEITTDGISPEMAKRLEAMAKQQTEKTFVLTFNAIESSYVEEQKMETPGHPGMEGFTIKMIDSGNGKRYTNLKNKQTISEQEIFGKEFLVAAELPKWEWKLEPETKKIGDYTCNKATAVMKVTDEEKAEYAKRKADKNPKRIIIMDEPQDFIVTVWYTTDIPVGHGPADFWGLPGLILESNDGLTVLLCSKIILNPKEKPQIAVPKNGGKVTQKEFDAIMEKKVKEMQDMNQGRNNGDVRTIRIGG